MQTAHLRPAPGRRVRYPDNPARILDDGGAKVPLSPYWLRRIAAGDVLRGRTTSGGNANAKPPATPSRNQSRQSRTPEKTPEE